MARIAINFLAFTLRLQAKSASRKRVSLKDLLTNQWISEPNSWENQVADILAIGRAKLIAAVLK